jgi:putative DNA primase/helicase
VTKESQPNISVVIQGGMPGHVKRFLGECFPEGVVYFNSSFHAYQHGYWRQLDEQTEMRSSIAKYLGEHAKLSLISDLLNLTRDFQSKSSDYIQPNRDLICLANGTLDTKTCTLIEHNPSHYLRTKSNIEWNPDARCDRWLQFLDEIFADDPDKIEKIAFIQEWIGYCLTADNSQHKFVWMVGSGGNGKSVLLAILSYLVGSENITNAAIEELGKTFVRAELEGKLVNISSEMSASATMADSYLKAIVSGDTVQAERKFQPPFSFKPFVKLIAATNHLPRLLDLSDGFFRRAIILTFNAHFTDENKDPRLEQKLMAELPGILVWAVQGLERLRSNARFTSMPSSVMELAKYRVESDTEKLFTDECLEHVMQGGLSPSTIYEGYVDWCKRNGFYPKSSVGLGRRLSELGYKSHRPGGKTIWYVGIKADSGYFSDYIYTQATSGAQVEGGSVCEHAKNYSL